jgi:hypothetical protein
MFIHLRSARSACSLTALGRTNLLLLLAVRCGPLGWMLIGDHLETFCLPQSECCLLVLNSVTSTPQWIRQPEPAWGLGTLRFHLESWRAGR